MTTNDLKNFHNVLTARQRELEKLICNREAIAVEMSADVLDQIQYATERELALGNLERESVRLRDTRAALRRIDVGTFGTCLNCEEDISLKRLAAVPWTQCCIACQEVADREGRQPESLFEMPFVNAA
jgi:RNA polymerase-binding transcription factor